MWEDISRSIYLFIENNSGFLLFSMEESVCVCARASVWVHEAWAIPLELNRITPC